MHPVGQPVTRQELRNFGLIMAGGLILFFGLLIPWIWDLDWPRWPWIAAAVFTAAALIHAPILLPAFRIWERFGLVVGWINTHILLGAVFYIIVMPIGLVMRLFRDPMARRRDPSAKSYRTPSKQPVTDKLERPF
ncbi:MAG: SxtJ family membrane protein [Thiohalocapsa sp.]